MLYNLQTSLRFAVEELSLVSLSSVPWSIRPLTTHDVFIFKVRFLAASHKFTSAEPSMMMTSACGSLSGSVT